MEQSYIFMSAPGARCGRGKKPTLQFINSDLDLRDAPTQDRVSLGKVAGRETLA
jgi:hypothetical protein